MLSDTTCPRPNMPTSEGLPQKWRLRTKKLARIRVRFLTVNIGTMTGKSREVAEMLKRRRVEIACVQETKWKGNKAREIGEGYKLYYSGASTTRNGVGIILHSEWQDKILEVKRKSDRVMSIKLVVGKRILNIISAYAPQTGCSQEEKEHFYEEMESLLRQIPGQEDMWIGADLNGHVGGTRTVIAELKPELLTYILQQIMANGIPDSWKKSKLIPIFKNKGDILECNNYRGIKLMSHFMKLWERIIEARLREIVKIRDNQFGFRPGMSTTEPVFALRQLQEKCREKNKDLHMVFVDLEKAFDRIPRDLIWWCLRKKGVPEEYVQIVQDMYRSCKTQVVTQKGETEYFPIEVGLHQGSALSPLLFIIIMDVLTENIEKDPPWAMMFADDLVLCAMTREEVEEDLETWRVVFERHGLKISRTKTEYLPSPTNDTETTVKLVDAELPTVTSFKYLGSLFTSEGGSQADVNNRIRIGWMKWKEVSGVMCDRKMPVELKDKVFKTIIRPAMTYGSECWAVKKKDESKLNSAEMRMLRWARGKTRLDHIRNEDIRKEAHVKPVETFLENKRLKWFGHCLRREPNHICAKSLRLEVSGRRSRGRPRKRWRDNIQGDMKKYRLTEDMAQDRKYWMTQILAGPAQGDGQER